MILLRGIKGEEYARKIEEGIVDCRDILSALLNPPKTGYEYSDYYEKNLVKAISSFYDKDVIDINDPDFLYAMLTNCYVPHIYLTYFHVLNENSLEWLDNFNDDFSFIAINVRLDRITNTVIGNQYFGAKMNYIDDIRDVDQGGYHPFYTAVLCSIEHLFKNKLNLEEPIVMYNTFAFPLLCREEEEKFTRMENEFRIIAYDCPIIDDNRAMKQERETVIEGKTGNRYKGVLKEGYNSVFKNDLCVLQNPYKFLHEILQEENGEIKLESSFKSINIKEISSDYRYIGNKEKCAEYIMKMIRQKPKERYVRRTKLRKYKTNKLKNVSYSLSHIDVKY